MEINLGNEQILIGSLLNDPITLKNEITNLLPDLFKYDTHRKIIEVLRELLKNGAEYVADSVVQLSGSEVKYNYLKELEENFEKLPDDNFKVHFDRLIVDSAKYEASKDLEALYDTIDDQKAPLEEAIKNASSIIRKLRDGDKNTRKNDSGKELRKEWYDRLDYYRKNKESNFVPLYFTEIDKNLHEGLAPGSIVVVAARPNMGKSTFCSNLILRQTLRERKILSVPIEAGRDSVIEQIISAKTRIKAEKIVKSPRSLNAEEMFKIKKNIRKFLDPGNLVIKDDIMSLDDFELEVEENDYDLAILDLYEYLLDEVNPDTVTQGLRRIKKICKKKNMSTIIVQQIKRIQRRNNKRPLLAELKNSGGYEEVADLVLLLHRDSYYDPLSEEDIMEVRIAKQRRGPANITVGFEFYKDICRIGKAIKNFDVINAEE